MNKIGFIINPVSGTRTKKNIPEIIEKIANKNSFEPIIQFTKCQGHAFELATKMVNEDIPLIVAAGGDGTVNEVARALIHTEIVLGIIPLGSGNGLARHLEIPLNIESAIELLTNFKVVKIDYGTANNVIFFCTCGVGFDALIGDVFAKSKKRGFFTYFKSVCSEFFKYKAKKYKFRTDYDKFRKRSFLVTFANASQYGNNAYIAPNADIQDGLLDVCILKPFPAYKVLDIGIKLMSKKIDKCNSVEIIKTNKVKIKRKKRDVFHFDGEPCIMKKKIVVQAHPRGLNVAVPVNSKLF